jgi:hypothetical protein
MNETLIIIRYSIIMNWKVITITLWHRARMYTFSKNRRKPKKSRRRKGEVNQIPYWGPTKILGDTVENLVRSTRVICTPSTENIHGKWSCVGAIGLGIQCFRVRRFNTWWYKTHSCPYCEINGLLGLVLQSNIRSHFYQSTLCCGDSTRWQTSEMCWC